MGHVAMATVATLLMLGGCATPPSGTVTPTPSADPTATLPGPSPTATDAAEPTPTPTPDPVPPYNGEVLIVTADVIDSRFEVTAMIPEVTEADGTCTLEVSGFGTSASVSGVAGNGVTYCGLMTLDLNEAGAGPWQFRVTYNSPATSAASALSVAGGQG